MANIVAPKETVRDKPSHLDLHFLHSYMFWSAGMKGLNVNIYKKELVINQV